MRIQILSNANVPAKRVLRGNVRRESNAEHRCSV
jgi:hypothetical protein